MPWCNFLPPPGRHHLKQKAGVWWPRRDHVPLKAVSIPIFRGGVPVPTWISQPTTPAGQTKKINRKAIIYSIVENILANGERTVKGKNRRGLCNKSAQKSVPLTIQFWYPSGKITLNRGTIDNSVPLWHIPSFSKIRSTHLRRFAPEVTIGSLHYRTYCRIPRCFSTCFFFFLSYNSYKEG